MSKIIRKAGMLMNLRSWTRMHRLWWVTIVGSQVAYKMSNIERWPRNIPVDIKSYGIFNVWVWMLDHIISIFRHRIGVIL